MKKNAKAKGRPRTVNFDVTTILRVLLCTEESKYGIAKRPGVKKAMAKHLGCSPSQITAWIDGRANPKLEDIRPLAEFFGVSPLVFLP